MDVANASMYDGSTAMAEAVLMAERVTRRQRVLVSPAVHPEYMRVAETYVAHAGIELGRMGFDEESGRTSLDASQLDKTVAAVVVQSPNFFGCVEDLKAFADAVHAAGALLVVVVTESASFGLLRSPGACGADIVVAEGQSFGVPVSFGGPYVGLFATRGSTRGRYRAGSRAWPTTERGGAASCSRSPRASSTYGARRPPRTSARTKVSSRWPRPST